MPSFRHRLRRKVAKARQKVEAHRAGRRLFNGRPLSYYRYRPVAYVKHVLKRRLTSDQKEALRSLIKPPYRVQLRSGHVVGKSFVLACATSWIYDTRPDSIIITTAPTFDGVRDILWRELRVLRRNANLGGFAGPKVCRLQKAGEEEHFAVGLTAVNPTAFQGKHGAKVFVIIDEAVGVRPEFWEAIESMLCGEEYGLLAAYNPTTTACQAYNEEQDEGKCTVLTMSCLNHPNIAAELAGKAPPYPSAIRLQRVLDWIEKWCDKLGEGDERTDTDFEFPPDSGAWYRPGPIFEARALGRWPQRGSNTIWSELLFTKARVKNARKEIEKHWRCQIGCDVARYGDDMTEIFVRIGPCVVHHEAHNGWDSNQISGRLKQLALKFCNGEDPRRVRIALDGTGGWSVGVEDMAGDYTFIPINSSSEASDSTQYWNKRAELWFAIVEMARQGLVDLSRLPKDVAVELKRQLLAQKYKIQNDSRFMAVSKDDTKKEIGRSPDSADALNLCFIPIEEM